jgi:hypothetical protein
MRSYLTAMNLSSSDPAFMPQVRLSGYPLDHIASQYVLRLVYLKTIADLVLLILS